MYSSIVNNTTVDYEVVEAKLTFSWFDYALFILMLGLSTLIGIYFGCFGKKQDTTTEYLLGGKTMNIFPIAMSLIASHISGITLLGIPSEVYAHGTQYWICLVTTVLACSAISFIYLPVFYKLQLTSCYEYLKLRFDASVRLFSSALFALAIILSVPIFLYIPALAFSQVTGIKLEVVAPVMCLVCIFYTAIGGLKAVVWSDTLQYGFTLGAFLAVLCLGTSEAGGFAAVWAKAAEGDRLEFFNMDLDPTVRTTFWTISIGLTMQWVAHLGVNQGCVQRFLAVPTIQDAKKSVLIFCVGLFVTKSITCFTGLLMYSKYYDCDPLKSGQITRSDQILPLYVMDVAGKYSGLPGLFVAGIFSAALSTMSASLNTVAGTIYEDLISRFMPSDTTEKRASDIMKITVVVVGIICLCLVFVVQNMGGILQLSTSMAGITAGPGLALFTLGMLVPFANSKGAMWGGITSVIFTGWIVFGSQYYRSIGKLTAIAIPKPLSVEGCGFNSTVFEDIVTTTIETSCEDDQPFYIFRISFYYSSLIGFLSLFVVALPVSWFTRDEKVVVHPDLLCPFVHRFLPKTTKDKIPQDYQAVPLDVVNNFNGEKERSVLED